LGERSYGKGIIQSVFSLSQDTALALTTAQYLTPEGRTIQRSLGDCRVYILSTCPEEADAETGTGGEEARRGGVEPDQITYPRQFSEFERVIEATNSFFEFAKQASDKNLKVSEEFEVTPKMLDDFQLFLSERRIRPGLSEWSSTLEFIRSRLKQEIFNLAFGVEKGDELEILRDLEIQAALQAVKSQ
jgi:carboxyl-terminal processing protease